MRFSGASRKRREWPYWVVEVVRLAQPIREAITFNGVGASSAKKFAVASLGTLVWSLAVGGPLWLLDETLRENGSVYRHSVSEYRHKEVPVSMLEEIFVDCALETAAPSQPHTRLLFSLTNDSEAPVFVNFDTGPFSFSLRPRIDEIDQLDKGLWILKPIELPAGATVHVSKMVDTQRLLEATNGGDQAIFYNVVQEGVRWAPSENGCFLAVPHGYADV